jgi:hypothetical protein
VLVVLAASAAIAACAAVGLSHAADEVYAIPSWGVTLTVVLGVVGLGGVALIAWSRNPIPAAATIASAALGVLGVLAFATVGLVLLVPLIAFLPIALSDRWSEHRRAAAIAGAVVAGGVIPVLALIAVSGPVVDCDEHGTSSGENVFMAIGNSTSEGGSSSSPDGTGSGSARGDNYEYSFTCDGARLVDFDFRWR